MSVDTDAMRLQAVRLALAALYGRGAEERDVMALAASAVGELFYLRQRFSDLGVAIQQLGELTAEVEPTDKTVAWATSPTGAPVRTK